MYSDRRRKDVAGKHTFKFDSINLIWRVKPLTLHHFILFCFVLLRSRTARFHVNQQNCASSDLNMDPAELEFIGENTTIGIIPNFTMDAPIHLISGSIGPFRAGMPVYGKQ